ncbi:MAG: hypothetical protein ACOVP2_12455 [Armatimonadaceae bacterium]
MSTFEYLLYERENHLFVHLPEGPFLVDTGSPLSFGTTGTITFAGETSPLRERAGMLGMNISMSTIRKLVSGPCSGLLGMDILSKFPLRFSLRADALLVGDAAFSERGTDLASATVMGVPMIGIHSRGRDVRAIFDTGAQYGYVMQHNLVDGLAVTGHISDYNPLLGDISSDSWSLPYQLLDENGAEIGSIVHETVGFLDAGLLGLIGADAIIGWHLLESVDLMMVPAGGIQVSL